MTPMNEADANFAKAQLTQGCDTLDRLLTGLLDSKGRVAEEVHAIRKLGKSLRGGFSLFGLRKKSAHEIQVIGRLLAGPRDAVSRLSTWHKIGWDEDAAAVSAICGLLDQQTHSAARRPPPETIAWCHERVAAARENLLTLPPENLAAHLTAGLRKLRRQAIKRCRKLNDPSEEDFHDARKALKAYLGALEFLPEGAVAPQPVMAGLAELLGDENDLATLSTWLAEHGFTTRFVPGLWKKLKASRRALRQQAMADAAAQAS